MDKKRILVVEDNRDNLTLILDLLGSLDYPTLVALDGEQALQMARDETPGLILLDLSIPRVDGWAVARQLKDDATLKPIPIIAITAHAMLGDKEKALAAGCDDYITKPINIRELTAKLTQYML